MKKRVAHDGEEIAEQIAIADAKGDRFSDAIDAKPLTGVTKNRDGHIGATVVAARTGIQEYKASEIGGFGDERKKVYRPEHEVFDVASMATYKGKAITIGHPNGRVTSDNWKDLAHGNINGVRRVGNNVVLDLTIMSDEAVQLVEEGVRELSAGYVSNIEWTAGVTPDGEAYDAIQRNIYVDHVAIVPHGRAGNARIGDAWGARPQSGKPKEQKKEDHMSDAHTTTVQVGDGAVPTTEAGAIRIKGLKDSLDTAVNDAKDAKSQVEKLTKDVQTKDGQIEDLKQKLADATSPEAIRQMVADRAKMKKAGEKAGMSEEDMEKMDDHAIAKAVVAKRLGDDWVKTNDKADFVTLADAFSKDEPTKTKDALSTGLKVKDEADPWAQFTDQKKEA